MEAITVYLLTSIEGMVTWKTREILKSLNKAHIVEESLDLKKLQQLLLRETETPILLRENLYKVIAEINKDERMIYTSINFIISIFKNTISMYYVDLRGTLKIHFLEKNVTKVEVLDGFKLADTSFSNKDYELKKENDVLTFYFKGRNMANISNFIINTN